MKYHQQKNNHNAAQISIFERCTIFAICLLTGCILSLYLGKDLNWDLLNYHFYNPWAWINNRLYIDSFPAQLQTFFNPIIDLPFYFSAVTFPDYFTLLLMGIPFGTAIYLIWEILPLLHDVFEQYSTGQYLNRCVACIFSTVGAAGLSQANTTTGEWTVTVLVIFALWQLLIFFRSEYSSRAVFVSVGAALGAATALKLTAGIPTITITLMLPFLLNWKKPKEALISLALYTISGVILFTLLIGPWMLELYSKFKNPLFPFFNSFFHSPLLSSTTFYDLRFTGKSFLEIVEFPFINSVLINHLQNEADMRDPRILIGFLISISWIFSFIFSLTFRKKKETNWNLKFFLIAAFSTTYLLWILVFGVYRYLIVLEFLAIAMSYVVINELLQKKKMIAAVSIAIATYGSAVALTVTPNLGREVAQGRKYFTNVLPKLPNGALVIILTEGEPVSYLIPQWPGLPTVVYPISNISKPGYNEAIQAGMRERVVSNKGPIFILRRKGEMTSQMRIVLSGYNLGIDGKSCQLIDQSRYEVCSSAANEFPMSFSKLVARSCDGFIDFINDKSLTSQVSASQLLKVDGWVAISADREILPKSTYIVLVDEKNNYLYFKTNATRREDVGAAFKKPALNASGYSTTVDIKSLNGKYLLGIGVENEEKVEICAQLQIPLIIKN